MRGRTYFAVGRRLLPALLVVAAVAADASGAYGLARAALLAAVPLTAVAAITAFGACLENRRDTVAMVQAILSSLVVVLLVLSCALRSSAIQGVPHAAVSSLIAALGVMAFKGFVAGIPLVRRVSQFWPAKP